MKSLKKKLASGELCLGAWVMLRDPIAVEVMAKSGLDWLAIDMEHAPITIDIAADLIRVGANCGVDILVRTPDHSHTTIKQVLDAGASGVIVPDVRNVKQAEELLGAIRYPALQNDSRKLYGKRGVGLARAQGYGRDFDSYAKDWNNKAVFVPMIEHIDAVTEADGIASIEGVDAIFVGPYDLSASMGLAGQFDKKEVVQAIEKIVSAAKKCGKSAGFHSVSAEIEPALKRMAEDVTFLAYCADIFMIRHQVDEFYKAAKNFASSK